MDIRTKSYLAKKHANLKESAFQSRSTYQDEFKTPSVLSTSRPRTRSTNSAGGVADPAQYSRVSHANSYKPRPRSIATSQLSSHAHTEGYTGSSYTGGSYRNPISEPLSPEYDYRTSNIFHSNAQGLSQSGNSLHSLSQGSKSPADEVRKWGSCSRLEYADSKGQNMYPLPQERTDGDGGPAIVTEPNHLPYTSSQPSLNSNHNAYYRRHSSHSSHSSDDVLLQQKNKIDEQSRVIDSLMIRVTEQDARMNERALSEKAMSESLDSGIDTRSETGAMRPHFNTPPSNSAMRKAMNSTDLLMQEHRKEISRLKLHVSQLEADRGDSGVDVQKFEQEMQKLREERDEAVDGKNAISRRFARLQEYLSTLPTIQEYHTLKDQIKTLTEEAEKKSQEQKIKNKEPTQDSKQKDADIKKYQKKVTEMRDKVQKLEKENNILKSQSVNQNKQELQKLEQERRKMDKTVDALKKEIAVLSEQKDVAKNVSGGYLEKYNNEREKNKIISSSLDKCTTEYKHLEDAMVEKERVREELSQLVEKSDLEIEELSGRLAEAENNLQSLRTVPPEEKECSRKLLSGCQGALSDLHDVVQVCQIRARGEQPNMTQLLGLGSAVLSPNPAPEGSFEDKLVELQQIQHDIEYLRNTVSDMYAEEVGNNCGTQVM